MRRMRRVGRNGRSMAAADSWIYSRIDCYVALVDFCDCCLDRTLLAFRHPRRAVAKGVSFLIFSTLLLVEIQISYELVFPALSASSLPPTVSPSSFSPAQSRLSPLSRLAEGSCVSDGARWLGLGTIFHSCRTLDTHSRDDKA